MEFLDDVLQHFYTLCGFHLRAPSQTDLREVQVNPAVSVQLFTAQGGQER